MKQMSEYVLKLEGYADLEVSIIRATKINKVLKAILKLNIIPKEEDFRFKPRSQTLLDKWNKLLASEQGTPVAAPAATNGAAAEAKTEVDESKASPAEPTNGSKESPMEEKVEEKAQEDAPAANSAVPETKNMPAAVETAPAPSVDETSKVEVLLSYHSQNFNLQSHRSQFHHQLYSKLLPNALIPWWLQLLMTVLHQPTIIRQIALIHRW